MIVNPKPSGYLQEIDIEALARMNAALISELWIMRDRLAVLEQLLEERGVLAPEEINDYTPREPFASKLAALRQVVVGSIVGAPFANDDRTVEALAEVGRRWRKAGG